jgi:hypothetical protein
VNNLCIFAIKMKREREREREKMFNLKYIKSRMFKTPDLFYVLVCLMGARVEAGRLVSYSLR